MTDWFMRWVREESRTWLLVIAVLVLVALTSKREVVVVDSMPSTIVVQCEVGETNVLDNQPNLPSIPSHMDLDY